jgi:hypothetical protein
VPERAEKNPLNLIRVMPAKGQDMPTSIFLAKLIGPFFAVVGFSVLFNAAAFRRIVKEFLKSPGLVFLSGMLTLPPGLAIVLTHNVWVANWPVLITIVGWLGAITGVVRIVAPEHIIKAAKAVTASKYFPVVGGTIWLAIGALLCFFGYFR